MLWYLHLCSTHGIVVVEYRDSASGVMVEHADGSGEFTEVVLKPVVTVAGGSDAALAGTLHDEAHHLCFISRSVNFPVKVTPEIIEA